MDTILAYIVVGFIAQFIDGSLGMAYGVSATSFLLATGVSPAIASASVHTAEVFTTAVSGASHLKFGNVDRGIFKKLVVPGIIGGLLGAYILVHIDSQIIKPIVAVYLLLMGGRILYKAWQKSAHHRESPTRLAPLGLAGGFMDAIGGGGWGPIVTSTLVANGHEPRFVIGSVNLAEFFVTVVQSIAFFVLLGSLQNTAIIGLIVGGLLAAPIAAYVAGKIPARHLMVIVGFVIIFLSLRTLYLMF